MSRKKGTFAAILIGILVIGAFIGTASVYTQDVGEVIVLRSLSGRITGYTDTSGFHLKQPWVKKISFDTRNMLINFYGDSDYRYSGGSASGPDVTINDKSGAKADIDIQVVYSLEPSAAVDLYRNYGTQTNYTERYLSNDLRAVAREVSGQFDTITILTDRSKYTDAVEKALTEKWSKNGLIVEQVAVQDIRYAEEITQKYAEAQAAEIAVAKAKNEQESARVKAETEKMEAEIAAETQIIEAEAKAEANRILSESLTKEVLEQNYYDTLREIGKQGNLVIVPEGGSQILNLNTGE